MTAFPFDGMSGPHEPRLEFAFEIAITFADAEMIPDMPSGFGRGFVSIESGTITGPHLNGTVLAGSGGDYAAFRPDGVLQGDARYILLADNGDRILMHNRAFVWGRQQDTMDRMRDWMFNDGPPVPFEDFYLRSSPSFETPKGPHEWMMRHVFVGIGQRERFGNTLRYYAVL